MDTRTPEQGSAVDVQARLGEIKTHMPDTYREIVKKATAEGGDIYRLVREGIRGVPNSFYAIERGWVQGTPFDLPEVSAELARVIVQFGCTFLIMWAPGAPQPSTENRSTP